MVAERMVGEQPAELFDRGAEPAVGRTEGRPWRSTYSLARHHQRGARGRDQGQRTASRLREGVLRESGSRTP